MNIVGSRVWALTEAARHRDTARKSFRDAMAGGGVRGVPVGGWWDLQKGVRNTREHEVQL